MKRNLGLIILLVFAAPALGHHSDAGLDMQSTVELQGTVSEFRWRNPHIYITVNSKDEHGKEIEWKVQAGPVAMMSGMGWSRDSIAVGDVVNIDVHPAKNGRPYGFLESIVKGDGSVLATSFDPITGEARAKVPTTIQASTSLNGIWKVDSTNLERYPGGTEGYFHAKLELTEKARVAQSTYDGESEQNPMSRCIGVPEPYITVLATIFPLEISIDEKTDTALIRSGALDYQQTVYMDGRGHPEEGGRTPVGHAIGWWEEDTLVVDTKLFTDHIDAYQIGVPSGAEKHVVERYRLIDGGTRIEVDFMLEDSEFIVGSLKDSRQMIYSPHIEILPFDCDPESAIQFLK